MLSLHWGADREALLAGRPIPLLTRSLSRAVVRRFVRVKREHARSHNASRFTLHSSRAADAKGLKHALEVVAAVDAEVDAAHPNLFGSGHVGLVVVDEDT